MDTETTAEPGTPIHIHVHVPPDPRIDDVLRLLRRISLQEATVALDLTALTDEVRQNGDAVGSAVTLLSTLADEIAANATDPAAVQALADQLSSQTDALAAAVAANTPADPGTGTTPPPEGGVDTSGG